MKQYICSIPVLLLLFATCLQARAQTCDGGVLQANGTAYVFRSAGTVVSYSQAYTTGSDAEYSTTIVTLTDTFNGQTIGSQPNASAGPNTVAQANQNFAVSQVGYGTYQAQGYVTVYDACTGRTYPPYDTGTPYTNIASLTVVQPQATFLGSGQEPSGLFASQYPQYNPNGSVPVYPTQGALYGNLEGASGTPAWTLSGQTQAVSTSCLLGGSGLNCQEILLNTNANAAAIAGCNTAISAYFTVDGLVSNMVNIMIVGATQVDALSPNTGQHTDHQAIAGGYQSLWYFQNTDSCGVPLGYVQGSESFPNSFAYQVPSNWNFPTANSWWDDSTGGWFDDIGFSDTTGQAIPTATGPQSPLNPTVVFNGLQQIYVGSTLVNTDTQAHYVDHGGYQ